MLWRDLRLGADSHSADELAQDILRLEAPHERQGNAAAHFDFAARAMCGPNRRRADEQAAIDALVAEWRLPRRRGPGRRSGRSARPFIITESYHLDDQIFSTPGARQPSRGNSAREPEKRLLDQQFVIQRPVGRLLPTERGNERL